MTPWNDIKRIESSDTSVLKYVFHRPDAVAEAVLYKYPTYQERTVVCCSTQSGCPVGCRFCGAGDSFVRSLTTDEIVAQPLHLFEDRNIDPNNVQRLQVMFMSMGEPLLNQAALLPALRELHRRIPRAALLISTSAPRVDYGAIHQISREIPTIGLQFSVHESTDAARKEPPKEQRGYSVKRRGAELDSMGRPTQNIVWFDCPFCGVEVKARVWSLSANGKRCNCGALFYEGGTAYKRMPVNGPPG